MSGPKERPECVAAVDFQSANNTHAWPLDVLVPALWFGEKGKEPYRARVMEPDSYRPNVAVVRMDGSGIRYWFPVHDLRAWLVPKLPSSGASAPSSPEPQQAPPPPPPTPPPSPAGLAPPPTLQTGPSDADMKAAKALTHLSESRQHAHGSPAAPGAVSDTAQAHGGGRAAAAGAAAAAPARQRAGLAPSAAADGAAGGSSASPGVQRLRSPQRQGQR